MQHVRPSARPQTRQRPTPTAALAWTMRTKLPEPSAGSPLAPLELDVGPSRPLLVPWPGESPAWPVFPSFDCSFPRSWLRLPWRPMMLSLAGGTRQAVVTFLWGLASDHDESGSGCRTSSSHAVISCSGTACLAVLSVWALATPSAQQGLCFVSSAQIH